MLNIVMRAEQLLWSIVIVLIALAFTYAAVADSPPLGLSIKCSSKGCGCNGNFANNKTGQWCDQVFPVVETCSMDCTCLCRQILDGSWQCECPLIDDNRIPQ
jgi:hypothetical protein